MRSGGSLSRSAREVNEHRTRGTLLLPLPLPLDFGLGLGLGLVLPPTTPRNVLYRLHRVCMIPMDHG